MSAADIARRVGDVSERSVRYRISRMIEERMIQLSAIPNPRAWGFSVVSDVNIECEPGRLLEVARILAEQECVTYVACSIGEPQVSVQVVAHDNAAIHTFAMEFIGKLPGVRKIATSIVPLILKDVYTWRIPETACGGNQHDDNRV